MEFRRACPTTGKLVPVEVLLAPIAGHPNVYHVSSPRVVGVVFISDSITDVLAVKTANGQNLPPVLGIHNAQEHHQYPPTVRSPKSFVKRTPDWYAVYCGLIDIDVPGGLALASDLIECYMDATKSKVAPLTRRIAAITRHTDEGIDLLCYNAAPTLISGTKPWRYFR